MTIIVALLLAILASVVVYSIGSAWADNEECANGHSWMTENTTINVVHEPTATTSGEGYVECSRCGATEYIEIPPDPTLSPCYGLRHTWETEETEIIVEKEPTATEPGEGHVVCTRCGEVEFIEIPALSPECVKNGHSWMTEETIIEVTIEPTATTPGEGYVVCSRCGERETIEIPADPTLALCYYGHTWEPEIFVTLEPTPTEPGEGYLACVVCGEHEDIVIQPDPSLAPECINGHTWQTEVSTLIVTKEPICTEDGEGYAVCKRCNARGFFDIPADPDNHALDLKIMHATCTEGGYTKYACTRDNCGYVEMLEEQPPLGHPEDLKNPIADEPGTCTVEGHVGGVRCGLCQAIIEEPTNTGLDPDNHDGHLGAEEIPLAPYCKGYGVAVSHCSACGEDVERVLDPDPTNHLNLVEAVPGVAPTCTDEGKQAVTKCADCNEIVAPDDAIPALGHDWGEGDVIDAATCTEAGLAHYTCARCAAEDDLELPALGHTEAVDRAEPATCTETGLTRGTHCSVCNEVLVAQEEVKALGHSVVTDAAVAPTCEVEGLTAGTHCPRCGEVLTAQRPVEATGHAYGAWTVVTPATVDAEGVEQRVCTNDADHVQTRSIDKLPAPATPDEPNQPSTPDTPNTPNQPTNPTQPNNPTTPNEPSTPNQPTNPSNPSTPDEPTQPSGPTTPAPAANDPDVLPGTGVVGAAIGNGASAALNAAINALTPVVNNTPAPTTPAPADDNNNAAAPAAATTDDNNNADNNNDTGSTIDDNTNPLTNATTNNSNSETGKTPLANPNGQNAAKPSTTIADDETPMASGVASTLCWVHWLLIFGIAVTIIYGAIVLIGRRKEVKAMDSLEDQALGRSTTVKSVRPGVARSTF